jgi:hypothetical protein
MQLIITNYENKLEEISKEISTENISNIEISEENQKIRQVYLR